MRKNGFLHMRKQRQRSASKYRCLNFATRIVQTLFFLNLKFQVSYEQRHEKTDFCICENKEADQLLGNREADQPLCFRYLDSTFPFLSKS